MDNSIYLLVLLLGYNKGVFSMKIKFFSVITLVVIIGLSLVACGDGGGGGGGGSDGSGSGGGNSGSNDNPATLNRFEYYWVDQHDSLVTTSGNAITLISGETLTITAQSEGYIVKQWYLDGLDTGQSGNAYIFSSTKKGKHVVSLVVEKGGMIYNTNIIITVQSGGI